MKPLVDKAKFLVKDVVLDHELPRRYARAARCTPVDDNRVLFIEGKLEAPSDAFAVIMPFIEQRYGVKPEFIGLGQQVCSYGTYHKRCLALMDVLARAKYVFLEDASDVVSCVDLRPETKVVQLWHACGAFKKWGMSVADQLFGNDREQIERHPYYRNLSIVTISSPEVAWAYREAMMLEDTPDVVKAVGVSRTDVFFNRDFIDASCEWAAARFPGVQGRKIILYAPTFRGRTRTAAGPDELDIALLKQRFGDRYALVIKHHPFVSAPPQVAPECSDFAFLAGNDDPIDSLMVAADVLVTDYSSVVFEYSLLGRPMAFFAYDRADYDDWRGFYYDYDELTPGPVVETTEALADYLASIEDGFDPGEVNRFRETYMSACDGRATERICKEVFGY